MLQWLKWERIWACSFSWVSISFITGLADSVRLVLLLEFPEEETDFIEPQLLWNHTKSEIFVLCNILNYFLRYVTIKCNKYNCLPWKMLNHAGNSYITRRKQLCHPPDTVMSHRKQLYHPFVYLFCILIRSGSRSNVVFAKGSKQRSEIIKRNKEFTTIEFYFIWLRF